MLLFGQFNYGKAGILDRDPHAACSPSASLKHLLRDAGFESRGSAACRRRSPRCSATARWLAPRWASMALIRVSKTLFSYQIYIEAETTPDVDFVLRDTKERSTAGQQRPATGS